MILTNQKRKKVSIEGKVSPSIEKLPPKVAYPGQNVIMNVLTASPPIKVYMPNHPHATTALNIAGMFAPNVPKLDLTRTGKGTPYLVPG